MDHQACITVVPPTPVRGSQYREPSPTTDSSATTASSWTQPPTPEVSAVPIPIIEERKNSSETIFSIYSMYGGSAPGVRASVTDAGCPSFRDSFFQTDTRDSRSSRFSKNIAVPVAQIDSWSPSPSEESAASDYQSARTATPRLSYGESSGHRASSTASSEHDRFALNQAASSTISLRNRTPPRVSSLDPSAIPLPPSGSSTPRIRPPLDVLVPSEPENRHASPSIRISTHLDPGSPISAKPSPARPESQQSYHLLQTPRTASTHHTTMMSMQTSSQSAHSLIEPSEDEPEESFHVRSTYAQLDMSGVKGDGLDEGIERTRARIGRNRASELRAEAAIDDGSEKKRDLTEQELALLSSLDRYGFFITPSHDRLISLPTAPLLKSLSKIGVPVTTAPASATSLSAVPPARPPVKEQPRIEKWHRMMVPVLRDQGGNVEYWSVKSSKESKLRERTYKGIPDRWRAAAWELLIGRYAKSSKQDMMALARDYREGIDRPSTYDVQIDLDVPRTISGHVMFRTRYGSGQRSLFHVLHSFSLRCQECGYCQGMGPIAATLLCYFDAERVYASLVRLHDAYAMHSTFAPGFPGLLEAIYIQERMMQQTMPGVYEAFKRHMVSTTSYATKWYITLFSNSVPFQMQLRLWDVFLLEGPDLFIVMAVAIVWVYRDHITSSAANFETVLSLLSSFFVPEDEDALLAWIEKVLGNKRIRSDMLSWRHEWRALVAAGKESDALL